MGVRISGRVAVKATPPKRKRGMSAEEFDAAQEIYEEELRAELVGAARPISQQARTGLVWIEAENPAGDLAGFEVSFGTVPPTVRALAAHEYEFARGPVAGVVSPDGDELGEGDDAEEVHE